MFVERNKEQEEKLIQELVKSDPSLEEQHRLFVAEMNFKQELIDARKSRNLTQNEVSTISGLSQQAVSRLEKGKGGNLETVMRYLMSIGCTLSVKDI